jgi:hypothetical protein
MLGLAMGLAGDMMGANAQSQQGARDYKMAKRRRRDALAAVRRSTEMAKTGEDQFLGEYAQAPEEMGVARQALMDRQSDTLGQVGGEMDKQLAMSGVRGGRAALIKNRSLGEVAQEGIRDIDLMGYQDALNRRNAKGAFFGQKAATGQAGSTAAPSY